MVMRPPVPEQVVLTGPAGTLEALIETPQSSPQSAETEHFGVILHPHPLHGGTMHNKVVHTLARTFQRVGAPTIRFNFRGVGASSGAFDAGAGETGDALAVVEAGRARWPNAGLWLAGFSFGAAVAIRAAARAGAERLVTVAPAVNRLGVSEATLPECPWLLVHGAADDVVDCEETLSWARNQSRPPQVAVLPATGHFFHGKLHELDDAVTAFLSAAK
jgi:hypothetical protein